MGDKGVDSPGTSIPAGKNVAGTNPGNAGQSGSAIEQPANLGPDKVMPTNSGKSAPMPGGKGSIDFAGDI